MSKLQNADFKTLAQLTGLGGTQADLLSTEKIYTPKSDDQLEDVLRLNNFSATAAPVVGNDDSEGYEIGSIWFDITNDEAYMALDVSTGAAVWKNITASGGGATLRWAFITDQKASGTNGGTFTSGAWRTRDLNTVEGDTGFITLGSNQITLPAGDYIIPSATAIAFKVNGNQIRLQNITDATTVALGTVENSNSSDNNTNNSNLSTSFTIASSKTFELQHRSKATRSGSGFGEALTFGNNELYAKVVIIKVE